MCNPFSQKKEMSAIHTPYFSIKTLTNVDNYSPLINLSPMLIHWGSDQLERADCISYPVIPILPGPRGLVWKRDFLKNNTQITCPSREITCIYVVKTTQILSTMVQTTPAAFGLPLPSTPVASHTTEHHPSSDTPSSNDPVHRPIPLINRYDALACVAAAGSPPSPHSLPNNYDTATDRPFVLQKGIIYRSAITTRSFRR